MLIICLGDIMGDRDMHAKDKEVQKMNATVQKCRSLDLNKLKNRKHTVISTKEALRDVTPINWSKDVLSGKRKVTITKDDGEL